MGLFKNDPSGELPANPDMSLKEGGNIACLLLSS